MRWRITGSSSTPRSRASSISSPSAIFTPTAEPNAMPARSFMSVVMATFQPSPGWPTTFSSGM